MQSRPPTAPCTCCSPAREVMWGAQVTCSHLPPPLSECTLDVLVCHSDGSHCSERANTGNGLHIHIRRSPACW